jgi:hypothetical protein
MSISTTPSSVPQKKRGMGCLGCGCLILVLIAILAAGVIAAISYFGYKGVVSISSPTPLAVPSFQASDDVYNSARQKLDGFDHDVKNHQAATIHLNADEINALITRSPEFTKFNIRAFVTITNDEGRVQANVPTSGLSQGLIKDRYFSLDTSFNLSFDPQTKNILVNFHTLQFGGKSLSGQNGDNAAAMQSLSPAFNQSFNNAIRNNPDGAALINQIKTLEIKDGELVIETQ